MSVLNIGLSCAIDSVAALALEENEREMFPEDCIYLSRNQCVILMMRPTFELL